MAGLDFAPGIDAEAESFLSFVSTFLGDSRLVDVPVGVPVGVPILESLINDCLRVTTQSQGRI